MRYSEICLTSKKGVRYVFVTRSYQWAHTGSQAGILVRPSIKIIHMKKLRRCTSPGRRQRSFSRILRQAIKTTLATNPEVLARTLEVKTTRRSPLKQTRNRSAEASIMTAWLRVRCPGHIGRNFRFLSQARGERITASLPRLAGIPFDSPATLRVDVGKASSHSERRIADQSQRRGAQRSLTTKSKRKRYSRAAMGASKHLQNMYSLESRSSQSKPEVAVFSAGFSDMKDVHLPHREIPMSLQLANRLVANTPPDRINIMCQAYTRLRLLQESLNDWNSPEWLASHNVFLNLSGNFLVRQVRSHGFEQYATTISQHWKKWKRKHENSLRALPCTASKKRSQPPQGA